MCTDQLNYLILVTARYGYQYQCVEEFHSCLRAKERSNLMDSPEKSFQAYQSKVKASNRPGTLLTCGTSRLS